VLCHETTGRSQLSRTIAFALRHSLAGRAARRRLSQESRARGCSGDEAGSDVGCAGDCSRSITPVTGWHWCRLESHSATPRCSCSQTIAVFAISRRLAARRRNAGCARTPDAERGRGPPLTRPPGIRIRVTSCGERTELLRAFVLGRHEHRQSLATPSHRTITQLTEPAEPAKKTPPRCCGTRPGHPPHRTAASFPDTSRDRSCTVRPLSAPGGVPPPSTETGDRGAGGLDCARPRNRSNIPPTWMKSPTPKPTSISPRIITAGRIGSYRTRARTIRPRAVDLPRLRGRAHRSGSDAARSFLRQNSRDFPLGELHVAIPGLP
jgi:hypothetical protein